MVRSNRSVQYKDNNQSPIGSVHFTDFPAAKENLIDKALEERMQLAQKICSMVLSLRKRNNLKVRQPLQKIMIPALNEEFISQIEKVKELILSEVNIKEIEFLSAQNNVLVKKAKADFKSLGPKYGVSPTGQVLQPQPDTVTSKQ